MNAYFKAAFAAVLINLSFASVKAEEVTLRTYSSIPESMLFTQLFLTEYLKEVNEKGKGIVQLEFVGGPEVMAPDKGADAIERGIFDVAFGPTGYYTGKVPEGLALNASVIDAPTARETGATALIEKIWAEKMNSKVLSWGASDSGYNIYLTKPPTSVTDQKLSLDGMKVRSGSVYKPVVETFGATPVAIPATELFTSLESGLVDGTGWSQVGLLGSGAEKILKYRIDPPFFRNSELILVNMDKWNSLSEEAKEILSEAGIAYEKKSNETMQRLWHEETEKLKAGGLEIIELQGEALDYYVNNSRRLLWSTVEEKVENADELARALQINN